MAIKKKSSAVVKKPVVKSKSIKKAAPKKVTLKVTLKKVVAKKTPVKSKKAVVATFDDRLTKEALKLVDKASELLRTGIKTSHKATEKARETFHKEAHALLGKATRHLDDALDSGTSFLRKTINKI